MSASGSGGTRTPPRAPAMGSGGALPADGPVSDAQSGPSTPPPRMHRSVDVLSPHTTFYTSTPRPPLQRQAAMSLLLKTAEGRERSLRALQNILRFYVYFRTRSFTSSAGRPTGNTTRLLLLVFLLSSIRKLRKLSELISPLVPTGLSKQRIHRFAGTQDLAPEGLGWSRAMGSSVDEGEGDQKAAPARHVSTTKWYWTEKHAWADVSTSASSSSNRNCPPASDDASLLLRHRLDGLETTLSLLDTVADGVALFARFGITVTVPFAILRRIIAPSPDSGVKRSNSLLYRTFRRAETLADVFWLTGTLLSLFETEWERREVWKFGKNVRRSMRDEELLRAHADRLREALTATIGVPASAASEGNETPTASKDEQLLALDEADQACAAHIKSQRRTLRDLRGRLTWLWWERVRLGADGVFALYDVFEFSSGSEAVRAVAGTVSAAVGFSQIWSESLRLARRGSH